MTSKLNLGCDLKISMSCDFEGNFRLWRWFRVIN